MPKPLTPEAIESWKKDIDAMTQFELARLRRFAPSGHPVFRMNEPLYDYFSKRFQLLGGMTPEISKALGWQQ